MKTNARELAYQTIKARILSCEYVPGCMLNETRLSQEIGVSRTPIREALNDLSHELLVTVYPKRGTIVNPIDLEAVNEVYQVRNLVEPFIVRTYGAMIDKGRLIASRRNQVHIQQDDVHASTHYEADEDLHQIIMDANPNKYLAEALMRVYDQNRRIRIMTGNRDSHRLGCSCIEHIKIIDNILCNEYEAAAREMQNHLLSSWKATIDLLVMRDE